MMNFIMVIAWLITACVVAYISREEAYFIGQRAKLGYLVSFLILIVMGARIFHAFAG